MEEITYLAALTEQSLELTAESVLRLKTQGGVLPKTLTNPEDTNGQIHDGEWRVQTQDSGTRTATYSQH